MDDTTLELKLPPVIVIPFGPLDVLFYGLCALAGFWMSLTLGLWGALSVLLLFFAYFVVLPLAS